MTINSDIQDQIDLNTETALLELDLMHEWAEELQEIRWFAGYLSIVLPPGPTGYFPFEIDMAGILAQKLRVENYIARIAIERISPQGARIALNAL